jgi:chaperone required for assembly of F1-ATPase
MPSKTKDPVFGDWFADGAPARNPMKLAQSAMRPALPRRFYQTASVQAESGMFYLLLDGKKAHTPARSPIALPSLAAATLIAAEWLAQKDVIDPAEMHATRMVNAGIDRVSGKQPEVVAEIAKYGKSDLLCYRADAPDRLVERQRLAWDPVLAWARRELGLTLDLAEGIMFLRQPEETLVKIERQILDLKEPIALAAMHTLTTLSGSVILSLAVCKGWMSAETAFDASELESDFTAEAWGVDLEAAGHRARRKAEFMAAAALLQAFKFPVVLSG